MALSSTTYRRRIRPARNLSADPRVSPFRMLTALAFGALLVLMMGLGGVVVLPILVIGGVIWLVLLPFREEAKPRTINVEVAA